MEKKRDFQKMLKNICLVKRQELYDIISDAALEAQQSVKPVKTI